MCCMEAKKEEDEEEKEEKLEKNLKVSRKQSTVKMLIRVMQ